MRVVNDEVQVFGGRSICCEFASALWSLEIEGHSDVLKIHPLSRIPGSRADRRPIRSLQPGFVWFMLSASTIDESDLLRDLLRELNESEEPVARSAASG